MTIIEVLEEQTSLHVFEGRFIFFIIQYSADLGAWFVVSKRFPKDIIVVCLWG